MKRISTLNKATDLFGAGKHGFRNGDKATGVNPTEFDADWCNTVQEELATIVEVAGGVLDANNRGQVLAKINALIEARVGDHSLDSGAANAYVIALNPAIAAYTGNFSGSFKAANTNTGASTLNAGGGAVALVNDAGGVLVAGDIVVGMIVSYQYIYTENKFYITSQIMSADARYATQVGVQQNAYSAAAAAGTADAITGAFTPAITALTNGMTLYIRAASANATATPTFQANGTAAKAVVKGAGSALAAGDIAGAGHWIELQYDSTLDKWVLLNPAKGVDAGNPVGTIINYAGTSAPSGYLACPIAQTNISRATYAALFAAIGTTWGAGDGATTFGMPWFPADYVSAQSAANVGTQSAGAVIAHTHRPVYGGTPSTAVSIYNSLTNQGLGAGASSAGSLVLTIESTGGAANLAAGVRVLKCVKY